MSEEKISRKAMSENMLTFRCEHRHSAITHPRCYLRHLMSENGLEEENVLPKVLVFDIETSPLSAYIWQHSVWGANVSEDKVISEWFMLTWSAKWLFSNEVMSDRLTGKEAKKENDSRIVSGLWNLLDEADIIIAHNGDRFDVPNMNTRFIVNNLPPTSPYQTIDTLRVARKQFGFTHNNLNALARVFGFDVKLDTDFDLWKRCIDGDDEALAYMEGYNKGDVTLLENVYLKIRPWIKSHPNLGLYIEDESSRCSACASTELTWLTDKYWYTQVSKFPIFKCESCGGYGRARKSVLTKEVKENLVVSLAR